MRIASFVGAVQILRIVGTWYGWARGATLFTSMLSFFLVLLLACGSEVADPVETGEPAQWREACAPTEEICNGLDDDCNHLVDDVRTDASWYEDSDGDGYGGGGDGPCPADGWVAIGGDCADADAARHPSAQEVCNGMDDDCDGDTDGSDAIDCVMGFADDDGDGDGGVSSCSCETQLTTGGDCDDTDPRVGAFCLLNADVLAYTARIDGSSKLTGIASCSGSGEDELTTGRALYAWPTSGRHDLATLHLADTTAVLDWTGDGVCDVLEQTSTALAWDRFDMPESDRLDWTLYDGWTPLPSS